MSGGGRNFNTMLGASACAQAIKLQHALELLETQTLFGFNKYLKELFKQADKKVSKGTQRLVKKPEFTFAFMKSNELLSKNREHPKMSVLIKIIEEEKSQNKDLKVIVFTQFRETARLLSKKLKELSGIYPKVFVGQAKKDGTGLTQQEQKKIIEHFSKRKTNVLCATCIAEEGLDIPEVNIVVFYEPVASAIRAIQRAGRTARLMKGKLIILMTKKTRDEAHFFVSRARERKMHSAINSIKDNLSKKKSGFQEKLK
jgi:Fanconi anemia group M protein